MWNYKALENLKEVCELTEEIMRQGKSDGEKAELLRLIADRLQPYIGKICKPVKLKWGLGADDTNYSFTPKTGEESSEDKLSSDRGILLWSSYYWEISDDSHPRGDQLWLLSSGKFLYIRGHTQTNRGVGWSTEWWIGKPFESDDPSQFPMPKNIDVICMRIDWALDYIVASITETDEDSFKLLLTFPPKLFLSFLTSAPCSGTAMKSFGEKYKVGDLLIRVLNESEDWTTCRRAIVILQRSNEKRKMQALLKAVPIKKSSDLQKWMSNWRFRIDFDKVI